MLKNDRGDTIVEVLLASAIFALLSVGALLLMNRGLAAAQRSLEVSSVRQQMANQVEALRFMNSAYIESYDEPTSSATVAWEDMRTNYLKNAASEFSQNAVGEDECRDFGSGPKEISRAFYLNPRTGKVEGTPDSATSSADATAPAYAKLVYRDDDLPDAGVDSYGIWIEAVARSGASGAAEDIGFIDFHVRACWQSVGSGRPVTLGTIVRLYDPKA